MKNENKTLGEALKEVLNKECDDYFNKDDLLDDLTTAFIILYNEVNKNE